jgi:hypothetical protein
VSAVMRVRGTTVDMDACQQWIPSERLEMSWRTGDQALLRRELAHDSGFTMLLSDATGEICQQEVLTVLDRFAGPVAELVQLGARVEVDFAIDVAPRRTTSIAFSSDFLNHLGQLGISVVVSAYPSSDDDDQ